MKKNLLIALTLLQVMVFSKAISQNVSINTTGNIADASAMLDITATDKGLLIPRLTQAQRTAITTPADALLVYQTDGTKGFYFYNTASSSWTLLASSGGSIASLNGLIANAQTFAAPTSSGTTMGWTSTGSSHTLNIPMSSVATVTAGLLSNADWTTFNNKLSSVDTGNIANFYLKVRSLHTAGAGIGYNNVTGVITNTGVTSVNGATGAINFATGNLAEATSSVLNITGGTGAVFGSGAAIQVKQANATQSGFLSSIDWNTFNSKASAASLWSINGNAGTSWANNFMGSTDNVSVRFRSNNLQSMMLDSLGNVAIGNAPVQTAGVNMEKLLVDAGSTAANPSTTINVISGRGYINNYLQLNIQNKSNATYASSDVVATNDAGNEANGINFIDMGVNSSGYSTSTSNILNGTSNTYLYGTGSDMIVGNATASKDVILFAGGTSPSNEVMRLNGSTGKVGIGVASPATALHVFGTNPLTLTGVAAGTNTAADSLLTITNGLVRKLPVSTFASATGIIGSINGLTANTQTFATSTTGSDFTISSSGSVHTFNLPSASATARGLVTAAAQTIAGSKTFSSAPSFSSLTAGSVPFVGTGGLLSESNTRLFWDATNSRLGVGINAPATALHVWAASNPLTLIGVLPGTTTTSDSLLTITAGLVKKLPVSTFALAAGTWSTTGNTGTSWANNFVGTTDNVSVRFRTNNLQGMMLDSTGNLAIGSAPIQTVGVNAEKLLVDAGSTATNPSNSFNVISGRGYINNYLQLNIQNKSTGTAASSDVVATNDAGTEANGINFIDMGVNSSGYSTSTSNILNGTNNTYLYGTGSDMVIGNATAAKDVILFAGGTAPSNEAIRIVGSTGFVGIGTSAPLNPLHVLEVTAAATAGTPLDIATYETSTPLSTDRSFPPQVNFVRQINSGFYTSGANPTGPVLNFGLKTSGTKFDFAQITTQTLGANTRIGFLTRTGMTNANPAGGTMAEAMTLNGNSLGIGTTTPAQALDVVGSINASVNLQAQATVVVDAANTNTGTVTPGVQLGGTTSGETISSKRTSGTNQYGIDFYTASANRMTITNGGIVGIGVIPTGSTYKLYVSGGVSATSYYTSSDRRLKTNINDLSYGLKEVLSLQPVSYNWKKTPDTDKQLGLIAQDVRKIIPEAVAGDETKENLAVNYIELVPVLINAIKEQQKQIEELKATVKNLQKSK